MEIIAWFINKLIAAVVLGTLLFLAGVLVNAGLPWAMAFKFSFWGLVVINALAVLYRFGQSLN